MTGVYITGHPLDEVADLLRTGFTTVADVNEMAESEGGGMAYDGVQVSMAGILAQARGRLTKKGVMMGTAELEDLTGQIEALLFPKVYEKYQFLMQADEMVILEGRLSFREDEDPKLLVDTVRPLDRRNAQTHIKPVRQAMKEAQDDQERARQARREAAQAEPKLTDAQLAKQAEKKLYLLLPDRSTAQRVKDVCAAHPGQVPVYVKIQNEGVVLLLSREHWCDADTELLAALRGWYGENAVVLR